MTEKDAQYIIDNPYLFDDKDILTAMKILGLE